ncbi:unnamed protein product [Ceutorhynchus assimilis]|uniref:YqaJ viral recombinase domain-containing protein n=1 Tax=Ceutorhynchus assimilis TaxID=467358 RepID=A0A9N9MTT4_9CUCU|nr:unnamed protein product [Ceutorhynchus assimilis]
MCGKEIKISNENPGHEASVLNKAVVWATIATGSTHTHTSEFLSIMDIPGQSNSLFYKIQRQLSGVWQDSLIIAIEEAAVEEKEMAIERGDIDENGVPFITVLLDGGWSKRSYGHTYNACSGVAVVIGKISGKLLFVGVRNKYCSICAKYSNKGKDIVGHVCFKNWSGSSSAMEADIIVEAFNSSIDTHGLKYSKFIADGDSTIFARIRERVTYGLESGLHHHVLASIQQLTTKAHLLLDKETNNRAELFMSLLARFNMGKRLNLIQRDSFQMRSHITGLKYNYGYRWHEKPWKTVFNRSPGKQLKKFMSNQERANLKRKSNNENVPLKKKKLKFTDEKTKEYGPNIAEVNLSENELKNEIENLRLRLQVNFEQQQKIATETIGQFSNSKYLTEKMFRLTASNFGAVIKRKEHTPCDNLVKRLLSRKPFSTPSTAYGKNNEAVAINIFSEKTGKNVDPAGLYIDLLDGFLAASPDGIINDDEIVEVKCSLKVATSGKTLSSAVRDKDLVYLAMNSENDIKIKENHNYYYQVGTYSIT